MSFANILHAKSRRTHSQGLFSFLFDAVSLQKQRSSLGKLTDAQLSDIGITREQAQAEARRTAWDAPIHWKR